jgi:hypothetical protein
MMTPSVVTLLWLLGFYVDVASAAECMLLVAGNDLTIPDNTECEVSSDFSIGTFIVRGTVKVTAPVQMEAPTIDIQVGGKIIADGTSTSGPGTGTNLGSGGFFFYFQYIQNLLFLNLYVQHEVLTLRVDIRLKFNAASLCMSRC